MIATRLVIAFLVGVVSQYMANLEKRHWEAVKCIMRYMKGTKDMCIGFDKGDLCVKFHMDYNPTDLLTKPIY